MGVQSHQFHRALDLAALALKNGCIVVIGGPHAMTCDTSMLQGNGVSIAHCEAELVWTEILQDALTVLNESHGGLRSRDSHARVYLAGLNTGPNEGVSDKVFGAASVKMI